MNPLERKDAWKTPKVTTWRVEGPDRTIPEPGKEGFYREYDTLNIAIHTVYGSDRTNPNCITFSIDSTGMYDVKDYYSDEFMLVRQVQIDDAKRNILLQLRDQVNKQLAAMGVYHATRG